ncbi:MAG: ammonium transporter [Deltaproteobacteria bacterium]|nr:ammonium transporter [Deltaproteobacteria bacterium]
MDSGDTAFILICAALVMLMTPGLAFFYSGMVRRKNALSTMMLSFFVLCLISVQWVLWGYSLAFGEGGKWIGDLSFLGLKGVGMEASGTIPHYLFMMFQGMFAIITVALITGAFAERIKFSALILFSLLWATIVYDPLCHWVWGGGWLGDYRGGALDFAGGTVVHISSGVSALVAAIVIGKRRGYPTEHASPHNLGYTLLGCALLWFGWFGFNAGSELAANGLAASAFLVTNTSAAMGALAWMFTEWLVNKKPTLLGIASGVVAGLVAITPAAGFVDFPASLMIGLGAGILGFYSVAVIKHKIGYDDSLDAFGVHGMCGIWGALATGVFANPAINGAGTGLLFGNPKQLLIQAISIVATIIYTAIATLIIVYITKFATGGLRVDEENEIQGLDNAIHGERAFEID